MNKECMGIINLNKRGNSINKLTHSRPVAAIPIGGRYRVIDFALSNMVNAQIQNIGIFAADRYRSLIDHLDNGKHWDLNRKIDGLFIFSPENKSIDNSYSIKSGDIYNIFSNIDYIEKSRQKYVLISPSYMICNINYKDILEQHKKSNCDITVVYKEVYNAHDDFLKCSTLNINEKGTVLSIGNNTGAKKDCNISMEMYVMSKDLFLNLIYESISTGEYSSIDDLIAGNINKFNVEGYKFSGYLKCINSIQSYFEANNDFLKTNVSEELFYSDRKILTKVKDEPPTFYESNSNVENSFISNGCVIEGTVKNSILFRRVNVEKGAVIENSIIMQNCIIKRDVRLDNVVFDKNVVISEGKELKGDKKMPIIVDKNARI
ncbi:MAG TPA: glucose-1-phosphate adenylyltransferase subunit GlgD [Peptostreptococcaceae bacterium]|nr:glucose-1-phosphate adenylyltransferase subunit GlgD [Peptostreptococcaceae bacterium]